MWRSMRLKWFIFILGSLFLLASGFRPGTLPYTPGAAFSDAATSHLPAAEFFRRSVLDDSAFPLWRETLMAGQPFAANPLNKMAYPPQWLALVIPAPLHLDLMIIAHLLIAGAGMWMLARSLGLSEGAAAFSALAYALAPRVTGHTGAGHLDLLYALAWFPLLLWSVRMLVHDERSGLPLRSTLYIGLFAALVLLADVRLAFFAYLLAGAFAVYEVVRIKQPQRVARFAPAAALVVVLTISLTLPLFGWRPYLSRAALTPEDAGVFSMLPAQFVGLVLPPQTGNVETLAYVGLSVLVLAVVGAIAARQWFWVGAAAVAALYALGSNAPFWTMLVQVFPPLLWFRVPARAWFVVALVAPLLAGYGVEWLMRRQPRRGTVVALAGTAVALVGGIFLLLSVPAVNGLAVIIGGAGLGLVCLLAFAGRVRGGWLALALLAVLFLELALTGRGLLEWRSEDAWMPPEQVRLAQRLNELDAFRVYSPTYSLQQQVAQAYDLKLFGGVDPFQFSGIVEAIKQGGGIEFSGYSVVMPPLVGVAGDDLTTANRDAVPNTAVLGAWGVTHVVSAFPLDVPLLEQVDVVDGVYIYANRDPALTTDFGVPAWVAGWAELPNPQTVDSLNRATSAASLVALLAFGCVLLVLRGKR